MTACATSSGAIGREALAALAYAGIVAGLLAVAAWLIGDLWSRSETVAAMQDRLAQIETRQDSAAGGKAAAVIKQSGSPFLTGRTLTTAGAALQERVGSAITKAGGALNSSQIDLDGPKANDGFVSMTANLEIDQHGVQVLLYDLEAGMPYLFVDSLNVQAPQAFGESESGRMRVNMVVSGQWRAAR
jgi:general secretion pathway protein M